MAWVAIDRAIKTAEEYGFDGPVDRWKEVRKEIHDQVCDQGFNTSKGSFTQYYGSDELDASLLMIPLVGFLPAHDPAGAGNHRSHRARAGRGWVRAPLPDRGHRRRGRADRAGGRLSGLLVLAGRLPRHAGSRSRRPAAPRPAHRRCATTSGLLSEEYDPVAGRLVGNFPQAFSHVSLVNSASKLAGQEKPSSDHVILGLAQTGAGPQSGEQGAGPPRSVARGRAMLRGRTARRRHPRADYGGPETRTTAA